MNWNLLWLFVGLNVVNVIIQTVKSLATVKCGKTIAALVNALAYGLYTFVVIYMTIDGLNIWVKAGIIALCNLVGVWVVKLIEEKSRKDKMWKVEMAIPKEQLSLVGAMLDRKGIPYNYVEVGKWVMFNCYCNEQSDTAICVETAKRLQGKISAYESKPLI